MLRLQRVEVLQGLRGIRRRAYNPTIAVKNGGWLRLR